jgi:hypothetical protein
MAKAYGDDLRRKFLSAYDQGEDSLSQLVAEPDLTLVEIQAKLDREAGVILSRGRGWYLLKKLFSPTV